MELYKLRMYFKNTVLACIIILGFYTSCSKNKSANDLHVVDIENFNSLMNPVYITDIFYKIEYISLESNSVILRRISDIVKMKEHYAISDGEKCYLFDM